jgi:hypothetical protein
MPSRMATTTADVGLSGSIILPLNFEEAVESVEKLGSPEICYPSVRSFFMREV